MEGSYETVSFDERVKKTLESNEETLEEINRLLSIIEKIKTGREAAFRELGITSEMEAANLSVSDLSLTEQKFFDIIRNEFLDELAARGMDADFKKTEKTKSKSNLTLSRKRLRI